LKAQVLEIDRQKRRLKLGMKQLVPTGIDEYVAEHQEGDLVSGRVVDVSLTSAQVELGDRILAACRIPTGKDKQPGSASRSGVKTADLASLTSMLEARWKGAVVGESRDTQEIRAGQILSFRITKLDRVAKKIDVEPVSN
jgi:small subunit ribosomal protein S1